MSAIVSSKKVRERRMRSMQAGDTTVSVPQYRDCTLTTTVTVATGGLTPDTLSSSVVDSQVDTDPITGKQTKTTVTKTAGPWTDDT